MDKVHSEMVEMGMLDDVPLAVKTADTYRKNAIRNFEASCTSLDNASSCSLLGSNLEKYSKIVDRPIPGPEDKGGNIYNKCLSLKFPHISKNKINNVANHSLIVQDFDALLEDLPCEKDKKIFCNKSEKVSQLELKQFAGIFTATASNGTATKNHPLATRTKLSLEERIRNSDQLQGLYDINNTRQKIVDNQFNTNKLEDDNKKGKRNNKYYKNSAVTPMETFQTARAVLEKQNYRKRFGKNEISSFSSDENIDNSVILNNKRSVKSKFVSPLLSNKSSEDNKPNNKSSEVDDKLKNIDPKMAAKIMAEIMDKSPNVTWNDIAGLEFAKSAIQEAVVWPILRPDIFTGLRRPAKGILLFGPPGTGKTLIGKCVAAQSKSTFFSISASSVTSKWIGDGEKMVRTLFQVARAHQPVVIFIDEIDSLLTQRSDTEHESSRRIKTEFLVQLDGATTDSEEKLLIIGATNRPQELDEAARRRFVKRLYISLPEFEARKELFEKLMSTEKHSLTDEHFAQIATLAKGYSGSDIKNVCSEAALEPIRDMDFSNFEDIQVADVRPLCVKDFEKSLKIVRSSVAPNDLEHYLKWDKIYGTGNKAY